MFILHGTNHVTSRQVLSEKKEQAHLKGLEVISLAGKDLDLTKLKQALESRSLFGKDRLVVIENLFSLPKSKLKETIINYLKSELPTAHCPLPTDLIIWESRQIDGRVLRAWASRAKIQDFKLSPVIFKFLDGFGSGQIKETLILLHQTLKTEPSELVFYLLGRRVRDLIIVKDSGQKGLAKMAPWQRGRLVRQAENFNLEQLLKIHRWLLEIDYRQKTGRSSLPLNSALDLLIVSL